MAWDAATPSAANYKLSGEQPERAICSGTACSHTTNRAKLCPVENETRVPIREAVAALGVSRQQVMNYITTGQLDAHQELDTYGRPYWTTTPAAIEQCRRRRESRSKP